MGDIYVAIEKSKRNSCALKFKENYLIGFQETHGYYEYPNSFNAITEFETDNCELMMSYILKEEDRPFRFYFRNDTNNETPFVMMFFNSDGSLFLGLEVASELEFKYQEKLVKDFESSLIMYCDNIPPPSSLAEFKLIIEDDGV